LAKNCSGVIVMNRPLRVRVGRMAARHHVVVAAIARADVDIDIDVDVELDAEVEGELVGAWMTPPMVRGRDDGNSSGRSPEPATALPARALVTAVQCQRGQRSRAARRSPRCSRSQPCDDASARTICGRGRCACALLRTNVY
jgi:hypothetical protein